MICMKKFANKTTCHPRLARGSESASARLIMEKRIYMTAGQPSGCPRKAGMTVKERRGE